MSQQPDPVKLAQRLTKPILPKRFYKDASVAEADGVFAVTLDGRTVRTPAKRLLALPNRALAEAVAAEWAGQSEMIDPATMPLTRIANAAIDGVADGPSEVREDVVRYAGTDLVCYRAETPPALAVRQTETWDPLVAWIEQRTGRRVVLAAGIVHVEQDPSFLAAIAEMVAPLDPFRLAGLHVMTTLTVSAVIALAVLEGRLSVPEAWSAAHVDEDWNVEQWGEDAEARARREGRLVDMQAAARFVG